MINSFKYAFSGIADALKSEPNLRIHFAIALISLILAVFLKFSAVEFAVLIITIFIVIIAELVNTVMEKTMDILSPERSEKVRQVKDISAAFVLFSAIMAVIVGILLFYPKII